MNPVSLPSPSVPTGSVAPLSLFPAASIETVLAVIMTIVFIWWVIFTLVSIYHLIRYARDSWLTVPAIVLHIIVSGWIFVFSTGGFH